MPAIAIPSSTALRDMRARFGVAATLQHALYRLVNTVAFFEWIHIIVLDRAQVRPPDAARAERFTARFATLEDLEAMAADPRFAIGPARLEGYRAGESCLLSYVDDELAGYAWAHDLGRAQILPGFVVSVPNQYLYNYAAVTLPQYRGLGLQPYRHHQLLGSGPWQDKSGLLGFVMHTNFASRRGQAKSGYRTIGWICLVGSRRHFRAFFSGSLRRMGIRRL